MRKNVYRKNTNKQHVMFTKITLGGKSNTSYNIMFVPSSAAVSFRVEENYKFEINTSENIPDNIINDMLYGRGEYKCTAAEWRKAVSNLKMLTREFK